MRIKLFDYLEDLKKEKEEIYHAIDEVFNSGSLILGEKVKNFEERFSLYCGRKFGVGVGNGTDAIFLALKAINIGIGDEVITVSNTAVPTVSAITATGAKAVFVDIEEDTYLMNVDKIENVITSKTKCILPVHLYGQCVDMKKVNDIARKYNLYVIEDCAQSHGAEFQGKKAGSMSHMAAFSFYPTKILGGFGDGGMIITEDKNLYEKLRRLRFYGMEHLYYSLEQGYNSRLDELHAAILLSKLKHIEEYINKRRNLANVYYENLKDSSLILPKEAKDRKHVYYLYVVRHPKRDLIVKKLKEKDIYVGIHYPWPIHLMEGFRHLGYGKGDLPVTEKLANEIFSLPMYPSLLPQVQERIIESIMEIIKTI